MTNANNSLIIPTAADVAINVAGSIALVKVIDTVAAHIGVTSMSVLTFTSTSALIVKYAIPDQVLITDPIINVAKRVIATTICIKIFDDITTIFGYKFMSILTFSIGVVAFKYTMTPYHSTIPDPNN